MSFDQKLEMTLFALCTGTVKKRAHCEFKIAMQIMDLLQIAMQIMDLIHTVSRKSMFLETTLAISTISHPVKF
jgi:hypothetical protein